MRMTAIISEYNPFHNGHLYQAKIARQETGADLIVAIMSGTFTQRGEPAFTDKWTRAQAAVASGEIDLVLELPFYFAVQRADRFALGGVTIAETIGAESLSFGSECGQLEPFIEAAAENQEATPRYQELMQEGLARGLSSATAASHAFREMTTTLDLTTPNNTLGYYYARAASTITLHTTKRIGSGYHDLSTGDIMSATAIRAYHATHHSLIGLPELTAETLRNAVFASFEPYYPFIRHRLLTTPLDDLMQFNGIDSSLAPRLIEGARKNETFDNFMTAVKTRRYTRTSLQRVLIYLLTSSKSSEFKNIAFDRIDYVRPLAFNDKGRLALREIKQRIPVISTFEKHPWLIKESQVTAAYAVPLARYDRLEEHRRFAHFAGSVSK
ncbi:nucleotidyltransferase family protein [Exiguobacterium sp. s138]|uniref:tRNA(Met) cytidine acetate ligase n=1 Tax=Exiguobacterium sp. s138 TaxID=2751202 RepID=UPI001BE54988|nr:nucleotidyltransferase family protein [Exiguobacterium sp. s138]